MEKNRLKLDKTGKHTRMSYARREEDLADMPNLIEVQTKSYKWFREKGLKEVFRDIFPISDFNGTMTLSFEDCKICEDKKKYTIDECKERDATYSAPLYVQVKLQKRDENGQIIDREGSKSVYMGDIPLMTETGSFVINGAERVIVSQLVRSPGIYYDIAHDKV